MTDASEWTKVLRLSHDRLFETVPALTEDELRATSYCSDWSVAQVLSHIGSGAEIGLASLRGALGEAEPLDQSGREAIWDRWNAKSPAEQAADAGPSDGELVAAWEALDDERVANLEMPLGPMTMPAVQILALRLSEHAVHAWDILVTREPSVRVRPEAVDLLVDILPRIAGWAGKADRAAGVAGSVDVVTWEPDRRYVLSIADKLTLTPAEGEIDADRPEGSGSLRLPAEAFLRLVYGRLDPEHTPAGIESEGVELDQLRAVFPGF